MAQKEKVDMTELESAFSRLNVWRRGDERAPHKPLLVLYALARYYRGESRLIPYGEVDRKLRDLLEEFGPARSSHHPELPFWHLQSDDVWELAPGGSGSERVVATGPNRRLFLTHGYSGGFPIKIYDRLLDDRELILRIARAVLAAHFPPSIHEDIAAAVGLDLEASGVAPTTLAGTSPAPRNPLFREQVIRAYEYRCAVCGFQGRLGHALVGLDAAHIKWHQAGGPDVTVNGLALCALHHKLFDRGVFTLTDSLKIQVSERANGVGIFDHLVLAFNGQGIHLPQRRSYYPEDEFIGWHTREVFHGPGRWMPADDSEASRSIR
jgi:putative restriction endonuclease